MLERESLVTAACVFLRETMENGGHFNTNYALSFSDLDDALYAVAKTLTAFDGNRFHHMTRVPTVMDRAAVTAYWRNRRWHTLQVSIGIIDYAPANPTPLCYIVAGDKLLLFAEDGEKGSVTVSESTASLFTEAHRQTATQSFTTEVQDKAFAEALNFYDKYKRK